MGELVTVQLAGEEVVLVPERALYWSRTRSLVIADPHFGKAAAFRANGIPVPEATTEDNLARLSAALDRTGAVRLVVLGDLLHARAGRSAVLLQGVERWRQQHSHLPILLVRGNHDGRAGDPPVRWGIECADEPVREGPFSWRHQPVVSGEAEYVIAGHIHPAVSLFGPGGLSATLPCFYLGREYALLPAFGDFTGTSVIRPRAGERVFVLVDDHVLRV
jgi:uncharacterized protein